jgi:hypothetical protein
VRVANAAAGDQDWEDLPVEDKLDLEVHFRPQGGIRVEF